jgi:pSer/pThr/pTyr-binding forkhead associated (FHA) protein
LIIETNDGTLINQSMSRVKRVTIENGAVVVIAKDGKIDRILLANVVKMSIEPQ